MTGQLREDIDSSRQRASRRSPTGQKRGRRPSTPDSLDRRTEKRASPTRKSRRRSRSGSGPGRYNGNEDRSRDRSQTSDRKGRERRERSQSLARRYKKDADTRDRRIKREYSGGRDDDDRNRQGRHSDRPDRRREPKEDRDDYKRRRKYSISRSRSRSPRRDRNKHRSKRMSPPAPRSQSPPARKSIRSLAPLPSQESAFADPSISAEGDAPPPKEQANFAPTGLLNTSQRHHTGTLLKHAAPPDSRLPPSKADWRLYTFKDGKIVDTLQLACRPTWLIGRDAAVVDIPAEHPSISGQHAVLQFREARKGKGVGLYLMDLDSANGTVLNADESVMPGARYVELKSGDTLRLGFSTREYTVILPEE
ncbi:MAG: hypothetical protein M1814_006069 [Vezdaea aestivalis]|nr:MAG: hypothetical protein M1814_006069 [Vezdaea aestivalis]